MGPGDHRQHVGGTQHVIEAGSFDSSYDGWGMEDTDLSYRLHRSGARFPGLQNRDELASGTSHRRGAAAQRSPESAGRVRTQPRTVLHRHRTVESYLYWWKWKSRITLEAASDLLDALDEPGGARWQSELVDIYGALLDAESRSLR